MADDSLQSEILLSGLDAERQGALRQGDDASKGSAAVVHQRANDMQVAESCEGGL